MSCDLLRHRLFHRPPLRLSPTYWQTYPHNLSLASQCLVLTAFTASIALPVPAGWHMPTSVPLPCSFFAAAVQSATPTQELVAFAHVALFTPALLSSLNNAALGRDFLTRFLDLTARQLSKHAPHAVAMDKGHLNQARKNQRTTKSKPTDSTTRALPPPLVACADAAL